MVDEKVKINTVSKIEADLAKLRIIRRKSPKTITLQEMSLIKSLLKTFKTDEDINDLLKPTIKKAKSLKQIEELMNMVSPEDNSSVWENIFSDLKNNSEDKALGRNIIKTAAKKMKIDNAYGYDRLSSFYERLSKKINHDDWKYFPELASEMLIGLRSQLKQRNKRADIDDIAISIRGFLYDAGIWSNVTKSRGYTLSLKKDYESLVRSLQGIEIAQVKRHHREDAFYRSYMFEQKEFYHDNDKMNKTVRKNLLDKNIIKIRNASKRRKYFAGYDGLVPYYERLAETISPKEWKHVPEIASEMLKALNSRLEKNPYYAALAIRGFLYNAGIWTNVAKNKEYAPSLKEDYTALMQSLQNIEIVHFKEQQRRDKSMIADMFESVELQSNTKKVNHIIEM